MPKETYTIKNFAKGLMSHVEARDLEDDAVYLSEGIDYSDVGKIRIIGDGYGGDLSAGFSTALQNYLSGGFGGEERILTFQHDYDLGVEGLQDGQTWDSDASLSGYVGPPKFREEGVTYYVVTSGDDRNELTIIARYKDDDGVQVFTTIPWDMARYNSIGIIDNASSSDPDAFHGFGWHSNYRMTVGDDPGANIVGYWVDGGFRYCDANFDNKNNNVVGYFGHINRSYLTSLNNMRQPASEGEEGAEHTDLSFTRNHWHFQSYDNLNANLDNPPSGGFLGDQNGEYLRNQTHGYFGMIQGAYSGQDGMTNWNYVLRDNPETQSNRNFPNYHMFVHATPNVERENDGDGTGHGGIEYGGDGTGTTNANNSDTELNGDSITFGQGAASGNDNESSDSTPLHKGSMPDGHELRKKWIFGTSILYDGDPKGLCQETGVCTVWDGKTIGDTYTYRPKILNLKDQSQYLDPDLTWRDPWIRILGTAEGDAIKYYNNENSSSAGKTAKTADFDALPKIYFSWTFLPWWADTTMIIEDFDHAGLDVDMVSHLNTFRPPYDGRMTGFRLYMQNIENKEGVWHNLATVDAMRGMVYYNGCSSKEHPWIPRGRLNNANGQVKRRELGHPEDEALIRRVACWSNMSTGRSNINWQHDGTSIQLRPMDDFGNYDDMSWNDARIDPLVYSGCKKSVNIESIPDVTYELLNGYKHTFSPTQHHNKWHSDVGPLVYTNDANTTQDITGIAQSFGAVYRFKTATVLNDRVYIGNVMDNKTLRQQPDRILKTEPGQYDIFPDDGFHHIDLASDDGDSIIKIMAYNGKLFVWKHHTLYVIKITAEGDEMIESTHHHYGIDNEYQVTMTKHGPCWFNEGGLYLYNHDNKIDNLINNKLSRGKYMPNLVEMLAELGLSETELLAGVMYNQEPSAEDEALIAQIVSFILGAASDEDMNFADYSGDGYVGVEDIVAYLNEYLAWDVIDDLYVNQIKYGWKGFVASNGTSDKPSPMIGYIQSDDKIIIYKSSNDNGLAASSGDAYTYDFPMKNFSYGKKLFPHGKGVAKSNFVHDSLGNLMYLATYTPPPHEETASESKIYKWNEEGQDKHSIKFITKDIDFESPGIRKKVYKLYITFSGEMTPNVKVLYSINGGKLWQTTNDFQDGQNYSNILGFQPPSLLYEDEQWEADKWYTSILKPSGNGQSLNNIYSIQLMFVGMNQLNQDPASEMEADSKLGNNNTLGQFVSKDFQINDISIIYRSKNAR